MEFGKFDAFGGSFFSPPNVPNLPNPTKECLTLSLRKETQSKARRQYWRDRKTKDKTIGWQDDEKRTAKKLLQCSSVDSNASVVLFSSTEHAKVAESHRRGLTLSLRKETQSKARRQYWRDRKTKDKTIGWQDDEKRTAKKPFQWSSVNSMPSVVHSFPRRTCRICRIPPKSASR